MSQLVLPAATPATLHHHHQQQQQPSEGISTNGQDPRLQELVKQQARPLPPFLNAHTNGESSAATPSDSLESVSSGDPDTSISRTGRPRRKAAIASQAATSANWASGSRQQGRSNGSGKANSTKVAPSRPQRPPPPESEAATAVTQETSSGPRTPAETAQNASAAQQRVMAALPRAKRPRRSVHEQPDFGQAMDIGSNPSSSLSSLSSSSHRNGNDVNGYGYANGSVGGLPANLPTQHHSHLVPGPSTNGVLYHHRNGASAPKQSSVREVIAGKVSHFPFFPLKVPHPNDLSVL